MNDPKKDEKIINGRELISYFLWYKKMKNEEMIKKRLVVPSGWSDKISINIPAKKPIINTLLSRRRIPIHKNMVTARGTVVTVP